MGMKTDRKIIHAIMGVCLLFILLILYLTYFEFFVKDKVLSNSYNQRLRTDQGSVLRGSIYDRDGKLLAESRFNGLKQERVYPFNNLYSHIIGYDSSLYGKSLLEANYNSYLSNRYDGHAILDVIAKVQGLEPAGAHVTLTIDHDLQVLAERLMHNLKGAAVVLNPRTGEVLAMVSKPDYDPNNKKLESNWKTLAASPGSPFMPRATQGLYAPGSTFKVVISAAAIDEGLAGKTFDDTGVITVDGKEFRNAEGKAYGRLDLERALTVSSNTYFAELGTDLGFQNLKEAALDFGLQKDIPFELPVNVSTFPYREMGKTDMASVAIGQGKLLVTPLEMAMIASCIANDGVMMTPWLVKDVKTVNGIVLQQGSPSKFLTPLSPETAAALTDMMISVVKDGTGHNASIRGVSVAGKTGTAQNESTESGKKREHAWFIGFAPADDPVVAVAVIAEFSGNSGGSLCAPIARELMKARLKNP